MSNELNIQSTYFPEERLPINRWFRWICGIDLNLEVIDTSTLLGAAIVEGYTNNPDKAIKELSEMARDNKDMVLKVIGVDNFKKLF